jgi:hypothetical protein
MKKGVNDDDIYFDKFTITAEMEEGEEKQEQSGPSFPGRVE